MSSKAMSLKGRIKNYARSNNIAAQVVLRLYDKAGKKISMQIYDCKARFIVHQIYIIGTRKREIKSQFLFRLQQESKGENHMLILKLLFLPIYLPFAIIFGILKFVGQILFIGDVMDHFD